MTRLIGLYGTGGCARGIMPILRQKLAQDACELVFIDDAPSPEAFINGHNVVGWTEFLSHACPQKSVCLGIASPHIRKKLSDRCNDAGISLESIKHDNVVEFDNVTLGPGYCISPFVTLTSNISIGVAFHANIYSYVEHDCIIGDFVTFAPGVKCNGNVHIGDYAYVGSGAILRQGTPEKPLLIGKGAVVGMGAVVTRDVPDGVTVIGNPARVMER